MSEPKQTTVMDAIEALEWAHLLLTDLNIPIEQSHVIDSAANGVSSALVYLRTLAAGLPTYARPTAPPAEAKPKFKLPPLTRRPKKPKKPSKKCGKCGSTLSGIGKCPNCTAKTVHYEHEPPGGWQGARDSAKPTVKCGVDYTYATNEEDHEQECVIVECGECGHTEQSWGQGERSVRRCLVLMGQNCPEGADNFYILERD